MRPSVSILLALASLASNAAADPTWPSDSDDLEEIMYQVFDFRARRFADTVHPCSNEGSGPGRQNSAEWLRTAFHDMSTANRYFGTGGLDASLQFELTSGENGGPAFDTTLRFMSPYYNVKTSLSDLVALGAYTSVRSCDGPAIPVAYGRKDATARGQTGVPQVANTAFTFAQQFDRMGFNNAEMIQLVACGHTLGGVHSSVFPALNPPGTFPDDSAPLDSTSGSFDNKIVTEYLDGSTDNVLVRGPSVALGHHSDFKVFSSDGNVTMNSLTDNDVFKAVCQDVLGRMINVVPTGVTLSSPIEPYMVKPVNLQLVLNANAATLQWTGYIRVRTTELPLADISSVTVTYKDRFGGSNCGSAGCSITLTHQGVGTGFDDSFAFYPINRAIPAASGISSFTVRINKANGETLDFDNNGETYPMQDAVVLQKSQTCLLQTSGTFTLTAAVRNDVAAAAGGAVGAKISYKTPRTNSPIPRLQEMTLPMTEGQCYGQYTFFSGSTTIPGGMSFESTLDINAGDYSEAYRRVNDIGGTCRAFVGPSTCSSVDPPTSAEPTETSAEPTETSVEPTETSAEPTETSAEPTETPTEPTETPSETDVSTTASATATPTEEPEEPTRRPTVGGYALVSCWTDSQVARALNGPYYASVDMTLEMCMSNCEGYNYWGTEYGMECFCGNSIGPESEEAPLAECNMACGGDPTQFCGAGNRLELYSTTATASTPTPTATLARVPTVGVYSHVGCWKEGIGARALDAKATAAPDMTLDLCADFCSDYTYFGAEYANECFCDNELHETSEEAPLEDCSMPCAGDPFQYCGAGNRLELYSRPPSTETSAVEEPTPTPTPSESTPPVATPTAVPAVGDYTLQGCFTEGDGVRALSQDNFASGELTLEDCATYCADYKYFGTEYSSECYCGNTLHSTSEEVSLTECNMPCAGAPLQLCGAGNRLSLYATNETVSEPEQPPEVGDYAFLGCYTEVAGARALGAKQLFDTEDMTNEMCAEFCEGYAFFGTEYSAECFCGEELHEDSVEANEGDCSMPCAGDEWQFCGAGNRLSVYSLVEAE